MRDYVGCVQSSTRHRIATSNIGTSHSPRESTTKPMTSWEGQQDSPDVPQKEKSGTTEWKSSKGDKSPGRGRKCGALLGRDEHARRVDQPFRNLRTNEASKKCSSKGSEKTFRKKKANTRDHQHSTSTWTAWTTGSDRQVSPMRSQKTRRPPGEGSNPGKGP